MTAAHLKAPAVPVTDAHFVPGCTGRPRHTKAEALAVTVRRGQGRPYRCRSCGAWHVAAASGPLPLRWCVS